MSYHMNGYPAGAQLSGKLVAYDPETGIWYQAAAGLGEIITAAYSEKIGYAAFNTGTDLITKQIIEQGGGDGSEIVQYAQIGGTAAGAALCAAYGAAAASPVCGKIGGVVAGILVGDIGKATTASNAYTIIDEWNDDLPRHHYAQEGILAVRGYLTQRDELMDEVADILKGDRQAAYTWANEWLWRKGLLPAPIDPRWKPDAGRWDMANKTSVWAEDPTVYPPYDPYSSGPTNCFTGTTIDSMMCGYTKLASMLKISRSQVILAMTYYMGSPTLPTSPIDWSVVGASQIVRRDPSRKVMIPKGRGVFTYVAHPDYVAKNGTKWVSAGSDLIQADFVPSQRGVELTQGLQTQAGELLKAAKTRAFASVAANILRAEKQQKATKAAFLRNLTIASALGFGGWWWWKRRHR
jgi:hypothetical protein